MNVVVVTPPEPDIDLALVKAHIREDSDDYDALIQAYVDAACSAIDGPFGWLGRCIWTQNLRLTADRLCHPLRLPYGPVTSVDEVEYVGSDGTETSWPDADYVLTADGRLVLANGASWPSLRGDVDGVRITYQAGFADVPKAIQSALLLMVGDLWKHRETTGPEGSAVEMSPTVTALLAPYRIWSV